MKQTPQRTRVEPLLTGALLLGWPSHVSPVSATVPSSLLNKKISQFLRSALMHFESLSKDLPALAKSDKVICMLLMPSEGCLLHARHICLLVLSSAVCLWGFFEPIELTRASDWYTVFFCKRLLISAHSDLFVMGLICWSVTSNQLAFPGTSKRSVLKCNRVVGPQTIFSDHSLFSRFPGSSHRETWLVTPLNLPFWSVSSSAVDRWKRWEKKYTKVAEIPFNSTNKYQVKSSPALANPSDEFQMPNIFC